MYEHLYENMTFDFILKRMLKRVPDKYDKREGSIIYDALAPAAMELAEDYIMCRVILKETFATTADRAFLIERAKEYNVYPQEATYAEVLAKFNQAISIGARFSYEQLNFRVTELVDSSEHTYKMVCETAGIQGNNCVGDIVPIPNISGLTQAEITKVITPGEDEEDTEVFRQRYFAALKSKAYGGNGDDYKEKILAMQGIGGVKVYRCWNGGGTVKCVVLGSDYSPPTDERITELQNAIDPTPQGEGYGIAPIGHVVTVKGATTVQMNVSATITCKTGYTAADVKSAIQAAVENYLLEQRTEWTKQDDTESVVVRCAFILAAILNVTNVIDVTDLKVNGETDRITLGTDEVPVIGELTLTTGA